MAKALDANQCDWVHRMYPPPDCCICKLRTDLEAAGQREKALRNNSECIHCGATLSQDESDRDHWESCPEHPARARLQAAEQREKALEESLAWALGELRHALPQWTRDDWDHYGPVVAARAALTPPPAEPLA
jgi:hypothetical protein